MAVIQDPALIAIDLRTYGEEAAAGKVAGLGPEDIRRIQERADHFLCADEYATASGASPLIAWAVSMAAVEIIEGHQRPLRWKRRKLKGVYPGC